MPMPWPAVFADKPLEISRCDQGTGKTASAGFIYPELGSIDPNAPRAERMKQARRPPGQARGRPVRPDDRQPPLGLDLMGRGIVEPLDDMDQPAWDQDLLDWLAADFVTHHGHDLKHTLALIASSAAPTACPRRALAEPGDRSTYRLPRPFHETDDGRAIRRRRLATVTGIWPEVSNDMVRVDGRGQGGQVAAVRASRCDRERGRAEANPGRGRREVDLEPRRRRPRDPGGRILIRKVIQLDKLPNLRAGRGDLRQ